MTTVYAPNGNVTVTSPDPGMGGDIFYAGVGNDTIIPSQGGIFELGRSAPSQNFVYGGAGIDTVVLGTDFTVSSSKGTQDASIVYNYSTKSWTVTSYTTDYSGFIYVIDTETLTNVQYVKFADRTISLNPNVPTDLTANGTSDIVFSDGSGIVGWIMSNGVWSSDDIISSSLPGWTVAETGDFTGNGTADLLLRNGGTVIDWILNNGQYVAGNTSTTTLQSNWSIAGTGDFTGNGTDDVLVSNGSTVVDWIMQNGQYQSGNVITTGLTSSWNIVGTGDLTDSGMRTPPC